MNLCNRVLGFNYLESVGDINDKKHHSIVKKLNLELARLLARSKKISYSFFTTNPIKYVVDIIFQQDMNTDVKAWK